jgi:hypothetical protein
MELATLVLRGGVAEVHTAFKSEEPCKLRTALRKKFPKMAFLQGKSLKQNKQCLFS